MSKKARTRAHRRHRRIAKRDPKNAPEKKNMGKKIAHGPT